MSQKPEHFTESYSLLIESRVAEPTIDFTDGEIYRPSALANRKHGRDRRATIYVIGCINLELSRTCSHR